MIRDAAFLTYSRYKAPALDHLMQKLRMMHHSIVTPHLGVFVFEYIVSMGAGGQQDTKFSLVQLLYLLFGDSLKEILLSQNPGRITTTALIRAQT